MKDGDIVRKSTNSSKEGVWNGVIIPINKGDKL